MDTVTGKTVWKDLLNLNYLLMAACSPVDAKVAVVRVGPQSELTTQTKVIELANLVEVYQLESLQLEKTITVPEPPYLVAYSHDGNTLAVCTKAKTAILFDSSDWRTRASVRVDNPRKGKTTIQGLDVSPDGTWVATKPLFTGRPPVDLWTVASGEMREVGPNSNDMLFLPNGVLAVCTRQGGIKFFDPATGREVTPPFPELRHLRPRVPAPATRLRQWTSVDAKFRVDAEFVKEAGGVVHLRKSDGSEIEVPLDKLSPSDREFVRSQ